MGVAVCWIDMSENVLKMPREGRHICRRQPLVSAQVFRLFRSGLRR